MVLFQRLARRAVIYKHSVIENVFSMLFGGLFAECLILVYLMHFLNTSYKDPNTITPIIEKIDYSELIDNYPIIEKTPIDVIEESEEDVVEEVEMITLPKLQLTETLGRVQGPQEEETYYNLPMENVVQKMRDRGYTEIDYPYYVREDGVKMLGDFIMVATDFVEYPRGAVVQTSLGQGLVCDKCEPPNTIDIAVDW